MKDLYTFDVDSKSAMKSYHEVQDAYRRIFESIGIPFAMAEADSGNIGGAKSHEYHFKSSSGEDTLIHCTVCPYTANLELAKSKLSPCIDDVSQSQVHFYSVPTTRTFLAVVIPIHHKIHPLKLSKVYPDARLLAPVEEEEPQFDQEWDQMQVLIDQSCMTLDVESLFDEITYQFRQKFSCVVNRKSNSDGTHSGQREDHQVINDEPTNYPLSELSPLSIWPGLPTYSIHDIRTVLTSQSSSEDHPGSVKRASQELCLDCSSPLESSSAIEVGHTFYLGTKYSSALEATFSTADPQSGKQSSRAYEMGCFGIGISRLVGAIAECSQTTEEGARGGGLRWPINVAPFKVCIIIPPTGSKVNKNGEINELAEKLACWLEAHVPGLHNDILIDDRDHKIGWKLTDAQLVGYPILVIIGNLWMEDRVIQVKNQLVDRIASFPIPPSAPMGFDFSPVQHHVANQLERN